MRRPIESKFGMLLTYSNSPAALDGLAEIQVHIRLRARQARLGTECLLRLRSVIWLVLCVSRDTRSIDIGPRA